MKILQFYFRHIRNRVRIQQIDENKRNKEKEQGEYEVRCNFSLIVRL